MIYRDITARVPKAAPFLRFDADPYSAVVDGRLVWIWDAYTTTNQYPYSDFVDLAEVASPSAQEQAPARRRRELPPQLREGRRRRVRRLDALLRGSVGPDHPGGAAFPTMFTQLDEAPPELLEHFRYPENLFQIQAFEYTNYHVTDPNVFYGKQDFWALPIDPTVSTAASRVLMRPGYVLMRLPGRTTRRSCSSCRSRRWIGRTWWPGSPPSRTPDRTTATSSFEFPSGVNVDGPTQVFPDQPGRALGGADAARPGRIGIVFGDFLVIPLQDSRCTSSPCTSSPTRRTRSPSSSGRRGERVADRSGPLPRR